MPHKGGGHLQWKRTEFTGRRWSITSEKPFDDAVVAVEAKIGRPNMGEFVETESLGPIWSGVNR